MLKHLHRSGMNFLQRLFNFPGPCIPLIRKVFFYYSIHNMGKALVFSASFRPISLTNCVSKPFKRIILSRLLFYLESNSISSPRQDVSKLDGVLLIKFCSFLNPFRMGLTNSGRALRLFLLRSTSLNLSTLSGILAFFINLFPLASLLALLVGLNLFFLIGALV